MATQQDRRYSRIAFDQIVEDLGNILRAKEGALADFGESSYGRTLIELFAAVGDLNSFWVEKSFNESWLETAKNSASVYVGAKSLGYSIRRPVPARAGFGIALKRTGTKPTVKVTIPKNTLFSLAGQTLLTIDNVEFVYDRNEPNSDEGIMLIKSGRAIVIEGTIKKQQFFSNGTKFQEFTLVDTSFSDWFGNSDPNYIEPDLMKDRVNRFTQISSDAGLTDNADVLIGNEDKIFWRISRRGLHDPFLEDPTIVTEISTSNVNKTKNFSVLVTTANDGSTNFSFGDGVISAIPFGLIDVVYISTAGEDGNLLNVAGSALTTDSNDILITQINGKESDLSLEDLNIALTTDIRGGLNIESPDSVKRNAPKVYSTLDSLGNRNSYKLFLSRQADVKYANAFGEDVISRIRVNKFNIKYANVVRYTLLKDLYREKAGQFYATDPFEYYIPGYKVNGLVYTWEYDYSELPTQVSIDLDSEIIKNKIINDKLVIKDLNNNTITADIFVTKYIPSSLVPSTVFNSHIRPEDFLETGSQLEFINDSLNRRGYLTIGKNHTYVPPIVHDFTMKIDINLYDGSNFSDIKTIIVQKIYSYLKEHTDFATTVYRSKVESLVQALPEVAGLNLSFVPKENKFSNVDLEVVTFMSPEADQFIRRDDSGTINLSNTKIKFIFTFISEPGVEEIVEENAELVNLDANVRQKIQKYYVEKLSIVNKTNGVRTPKTTVTEEELNLFTSYIWTTGMNEVYTNLNNQYSDAKENGNADETKRLFNLIEALRGWYFKDGVVLFKDTDLVLNLQEDSTNALFKYKTYILEYIKMVRNVFATISARKLIDIEGNITNYSNENEIVQFSISSSDITIKLGK